ncbi:HNH endonuclease [Microbacterium sp. 22242]|uniref:HNH endonuclease n=1 Tax=Microbacterium sp. 22242 TaxID=3453896 RepID=UPI003F870154
MTMVPLSLTPKAAERFWSHVDRRGPNDCWPWTRSRSSRGYGKFRVGRQMRNASRVAYELVKGPLGSNEARHTCDNPPCCNPAHLLAGSHAANMRDMAERERSRTTRLTATQVREIRRRHAHESLVTLAAEYGVTPSNVSLIVRRRTWKHLGEAA